jgi:GT2 family glycosyltransferase
VLQDHAGGTQAKNTGALASQGDLLVFLDDDITVVPHFLRCIAREHTERDHLILVGTLHPVKEDTDAAQLLQALLADKAHVSAHSDSIEIPYVDCLGGFFSVRRSDFLALGMLQDVAPGFWPNWEDVEFAYRASQQGFHFRQSLGAEGYHRDHVLADLETTLDRWERAAYAAVLLFQKHPALEYELPMFPDKGPISLSADPPRLIVRKCLRIIMSSPPSVFVLQNIAQMLERNKPDSYLLVRLRRWLISAYAFRGFRRGLLELGPTKALGTTTA